MKRHVGGRNKPIRRIWRGIVSSKVKLNEFSLKKIHYAVFGYTIKFFLVIGDCAPSLENGLIDFLHANVITLTVCNGIAEIS